MKDKRFPAGGKRCGSLIALTLAACMLVGLAVQPVGEAKAVDLSRENSLLVKTEIDMTQDAEKADIAIDLYKVANAVMVDGYDTYAFHVTDSLYKDLESLKGNFEENIKTIQSPGNKDLPNETYQKVVQEVAKATFKDLADVPDPAKTGMVGEDITKIESGLYLLVAHDANLTPNEYVTTVGETAEFATIAYSKERVYTFEPQLISLPTKEAVDGVVATSNPGEWLNNAEVSLKYGYAPRFGNLQIVKNISGNNFLETESFVFQIEATKDGEFVYSNVVTATCSNGEVEPILLSGVIPVGARVEVTEVYSGASYAIDNEQNRTQTVDILAPDNGVAARVEFTNVYQGTTTSGGAIINEFKYTNGVWDWKKNPIVPDLQQ